MTICPSDCEAPHSIEEIRNPSSAPMCRFLRPNRAAIQPTGAVMIAEATTYDVSTQVI